jgi:hypothetical protein
LEATRLGGGDLLEDVAPLNALERFQKIAHFERTNDPFVWSIWTW